MLVFSLSSMKEGSTQPKDPLAERVEEIIERQGVQDQFGPLQDLIIEGLRVYSSRHGGDLHGLNRLIRKRLPEEPLPFRQDLAEFITQVHVGIRGIQGVPGKHTEADKHLDLKGPARIKTKSDYASSRKKYL